MTLLCRQIRICLTVAMLLLVAGFGPRAAAQSSAVVSGQVVDSTGALIKGATATLVRPSTQVTNTATSDAKGNFILPPVAPGNYELTVTADGFAKWKVTGILLEVGQQKALNAVLAVSSTDTVTVQDVPPEINTDDAQRSVVTERELVANIPLDVRNPLQLTNFSPGVTQSNSLTAGTNASSQSTTNTFYINGAKGGESEITIDGAADTVFYDTHAAGAIPGLDAVQEIRIYSAAYLPEFGHTGGGIQAYSIKSGTNNFHGGAWEYFRNAAMDANGYNANRAGQAKPSFQRNQFGGQIGGPVIIPKLYSGRNKTFFFGSYEELLDSTPGAGFTTTVPTALEKAGDFSQTFNTDGSLLTVYDPTTTQMVAAAGTYTCPNGKSFTASKAGFYRC